MTPEPGQAAAELDAGPTNEKVIPPEWLVWATAIEKREDLRSRLARRPERARLAEVLAREQDENGELAWGAEALDFVTQLRASSDRPEDHPPRPRWHPNRRPGA